MAHETQYDINLALQVCDNIDHHADLFQAQGDAIIEETRTLAHVHMQGETGESVDLVANKLHAELIHSVHQTKAATDHIRESNHKMYHHASQSAHTIQQLANLT